MSTTQAADSSGSWLGDKLGHNNSKISGCNSSSTRFRVTITQHYATKQPQEVTLQDLWNFLPHVLQHPQTFISKTLRTSAPINQSKGSGCGECAEVGKIIIRRLPNILLHIKMARYSWCIQGTKLRSAGGGHMQRIGLAVIVMNTCQQRSEHLDFVLSGHAASTLEP